MTEEDSFPDSSRPWFYRPEFFYAFFIFPPVWSILALRSPWNNSVITGGVAWAILIVGAVMCFKWVQNGSPENLFLFVPGVILTVVTQVQWARSRAENRPPATVGAESPAVPGQERLGSSRPPRPTARRRRRVRR